MNHASLRAIGAADLPRILALNARVQDKTSPLDAARLQQLLHWSDHARVAQLDGQVVAFLLSMRDGSAYDSRNYHWFAARFPRFQYVDRVVVDADAAGHGIGRALYTDLIAHARGNRQPVLVCEYNAVPPNPASAAFHQRLGFAEVGRHTVQHDKQVSMQCLDLLPAVTAGT